MVVNNTITPTVMLAASNKSISAGGNGTKITIKQLMMPSGRMRSR